MPDQSIPKTPPSQQAPKESINKSAEPLKSVKPNSVPVPPKK